MTFFQLAIFTVISLFAGFLTRPRRRVWVLMTGSLVLIYWLQPASPVRHLDFWLPTATLGLILVVYGITRPAPRRFERSDLPAALTVVLTVSLIAGLRYLSPICCVTPTPPPVFTQALVGLLVWALLAALAYFAAGKKAASAAAVILILAAFLFLKNETLGIWASVMLRSFTGQNTSLAQTSDLAWLGYSYVAFRLLHVIQDARAGRLGEFGLDEFITYLIFFPAYAAGPIDRVQRFTADLRKAERLDPARVQDGVTRLLVGIFKKFAVADTLALMALSPLNAGQLQDSGWAWVVVYAYALRIYFDFAGYTDIAIGLGLLAGVRLPENFNHPYRQPNLTVFWNNWHMTLTQWFRGYFFNPLTRALRSSKRKIAVPVIILVTQLATMALIGLWHGISWNFLIWGAWHGLGLFIHNRWREWAGPRLALETRPAAIQQALSFLGWALTFNFVALGWLWFALPTPEQSFSVFKLLFGF
jgi:D-alanyl-lipoteichoic acid acyltransferase DltB (MBOAT superfamily)